MITETATNDGRPHIAPKRGDRLVQCGYCFANVWESNEQDWDVNTCDWERESRQHFSDCEWVATRAHTA